MNIKECLIKNIDFNKRLTDVAIYENFILLSSYSWIEVYDINQNYKIIKKIKNLYPCTNILLYKNLLITSTIKIFDISKNYKFLRRINIKNRKKNDKYGDFKRNFSL